MSENLSSTDGNNSGDTPGLELTGKIMVVAILLLFFVIVIVCFIHLYAKWFWWSIENSDTAAARGGAGGGRRRRRRIAFSQGQDPMFQRRGLEAHVMRSLPMCVYRSEDYKDGLECAVCLSDVVDGEKARILPKCNHGFHVECIDMWFHSHSTCPICRSLVGSLESSSQSTNPNHTLDVGGNGVENYSDQSSDSDSSDSSSEENDLEAANVPTNVLFWGDQTQVNSVGAGSSIEAPSSSTSSSSVAADSSASTTSSSGTNNNNKRGGMLVIDIPREVNPLPLASTSRCPEDEVKSPMTSRLQSFKRMLSMKFSPRGSSSVDVEQAGKGQS